MVTYKLMLDERRAKQDGTYPIVIRVTFNRSNTIFQTGVSIRIEAWDRVTSLIIKNYPNAPDLNSKISTHFLKIQKVILRLEEDEDFSFEELKERLDMNKKAIIRLKPYSFNEFAQQQVQDMISINKAGNAIVYRVASNRFMQYANNPKLKFVEITYTFLDGFKRQLMKDGVKQNTISNYFRTIRAIYNKAIKAKLVDRSHYPFLDIPIKTERTAKRAISTNDLIKIVKSTLKDHSQEWHARNYFLLSFTLIGASFTDLAYLKPSNIKKGRLVYKRRKTGKELSIKVCPFALGLLSYYTNSNPKYLLPILLSDTVEDSMDAKLMINQAIKTTNKYLKRIAGDCEIEDDVTTYVARHTWATSAKRLGFSIELISEAMGHEYGNKITNIYLDSFDQSLIDEVNEKVLDSIR